MYPDETVSQETEPLQAGNRSTKKGSETSRQGLRHYGLYKQIQGEHQTGVGDGGLRAAVFGFCDGLLSNSCLILGVYGAISSGGMSLETLLITGFAGMVAGAASMCCGEWISMTAQEEAERKELVTERRHIVEYYDEEANEFAEFLTKHGVSEQTAQAVTADIMQGTQPVNDMLHIHAKFEFGIDPDEAEGAAPIKAAVFSFCTFAVGGFIPLLPWVLDFILKKEFGHEVMGRQFTFILTLVLATLAQFAAGAVLASYTGRSAVWSGSRQLLVGATAAVFCFFVGRLFGVAVS